MSSSTGEVDDDDNNNDEKNVSTTSIASSSSSSSSSFDSTTHDESSLQLRQIHEIPREIGGVPLPRLEPPAPAEFGSLVIKDSRGPHIGNTIIYEQPITIRQIVYANGTAAAGHEDSERDDATSCASSVDEKRYHEKKRSPTTIDKSDGFARANDFVKRKKRLYIYAAIGAMSIVVVVAVTLGVTLPRSVSESVDESVDEPSDHRIVTSEVAVVDVPRDEPTKPPNEEESAISWLVNRTSWLARPARRTRPLALSPVPYLIVSETSDDRSGCLDGDSCRRAIRRRQLYDLDSLGRDDIGPSFLVGGDGNVYEGRGWWVAGQHTGPGYDERSLGLAFVGQLDSAAAASCRRQIEAARGFIELAVARGRLAENYRVYAEKQLRVGSTSPGERLYAAVKNWTHWSPVAPSIDDLL